MAGELKSLELRSKDKLLLVDDDLNFMGLIQEILRIKGFAVDTAYNAEEALLMIQEKQYNLVILDLHLPDMNGLEMLSSIKSIQPDILSIILTGYSSVENSVQSLNLGAFAYLEKPVHPERLMEVIDRGLEKQNLLRENRRLLKELEQRNKDLNILLTVTQALSGSLKPDQIVSSALEIVNRSLGFGGYMLALYHGRSVLNEYRGFNDQLLERLKNIELRESLLGNVLRQSQPLILNQINGNPDYFLSSLTQAGYKSLLAVPMVSANETSGIIGVTTTAEHIFMPMEVDLLRAIGREIAVAISNSQLFEEASSAQALRELDILRTELLANVSHELRTPLAAIKGFASSLLQTDISFDEETRTSFIRTIDNEADRLNNLINDLLLMSRIEAGVYKSKMGCYSMREIVDAIRDRLYSIAIKHNLRIIVPDNLPEILVDGSRIGQVITNLVENAVKYSPEGGEIRIETLVDNQDIITSVIDSGEGIPAEFQEKIFRRFNQLNSNGHRKGSGLGLCISRGIVESHKGKIWVESQPGHGAKFRFSLPVYQATL
jgi:K+-sensing histidine kinase KdpD